MEITDKEIIDNMCEVINKATFTYKELTIAFKAVAVKTKLKDREVIEYGKERGENKSQETGEGYSRNSSRR